MSRAIHMDIEWRNSILITNVAQRCKGGILLLARLCRGGPIEFWVLFTLSGQCGLVIWDDGLLVVKFRG